MRSSWSSLVPSGDSVEEHWCFVCESWIHCCTCPPEQPEEDEEEDLHTVPSM